MKDLYLSCTHIGSPLFKSEKEITTLLLKDYYNIYLLGDVFDVWEGHWETIRADNFKIVDLLKEVSNHIPIYYIIGNHDPNKHQIEETFPKVIVCDFHTRTIGNDVIMLKHGDEFDSWFVSYKPMSKFLYYVFVHPFYRFGINWRDAVKNKLHNLKVKWSTADYNTAILDIEKRALFAHSKIIMGHTHIPKVFQNGRFWYINPGDWVYNRSYIEYDYNSNEFILFKGWGIKQ